MNVSDQIMFVVVVFLGCSLLTSPVQTSNVESVGDNSTVVESLGENATSFESLSANSTGVDLKNFTKDTNVTALWELYKTKYNKSYDADEAEKRFHIFADNVKIIAEHNEKYANGESTYKTGLNGFADMSPEEFRSRLGVRTGGGLGR